MPRASAYFTKERVECSRVGPDLRLYDGDA
jgi:hypothetical protein